MSRDKLLKLAFKEQKIKISGEEYIVKEMTAAAASEYEQSVISIVNDKAQYNMKRAKIQLVQSTLCDAEGNKVFEKKDEGLIEQLPSSVVNEIFNIASEINNMAEGVVEKN